MSNITQNPPSHQKFLLLAGAISAGSVAAIAVPCAQCETDQDARVADCRDALYEKTAKCDTDQESGFKDCKDTWESCEETVMEALKKCDAGCTTLPCLEACAKTANDGHAGCSESKFGCELLVEQKSNACIDDAFGPYNQCIGASNAEYLACVLSCC